MVIDPKVTTIELKSPCPSCMEHDPEGCKECNETGFLVTSMTLTDFLSRIRAIIPESNTLAQQQQELNIEWNEDDS